MSSSAPVVRLDEFVARRARKTQGGIGAQRGAVPTGRGSAGPEDTVEAVATPTPVPARTTPTRRAPRPGLVRACAGRAQVEGPPAPHGIGLTRRGRVAVALLAATAVSVVLAGLGAVGPGSTPATGSDAVPAGRTTTVTVKPGQTLWDIASRFAPGSDVRATVDQIAELNHLQSAGDIEAGRRLVVPVSSR